MENCSHPHLLLVFFLLGSAPATLAPLLFPNSLSQCLRAFARAMASTETYPPPPNPYVPLTAFSFWVVFFFLSFVFADISPT